MGECRTEDLLDSFKDFLTENELFEIKTLRRDIEPLLNNQILRHFTDHTITHSDRMIKILRDILNLNLLSSKESKLKHQEIYILLLATYLHDISMQIPEVFRIKKEITDFGNEEYNFIRENHGDASAEILVDIIKTGKDDHKILININKRNIKPFIPSVCQICANHQSNKEYGPDEIIAVSGETIRIGILTGLLRIADQLDCDCRRVDMNKLDQYSISLESKIHWITCEYIDTVDIKNGNIRLFASFPESISSSIIDYISGKLCHKINIELEYCIDSLFENGIYLHFGGKLIRQKWDLSCTKTSLPDSVQDLIQKQIIITTPKHIITKMEKDSDNIDWMSYWNLIGNPFLDQPLSYGSKYYVETKKLKKISSEIESIIKANQGDIRLLLGERGLGKTTLFEVINGKFKNNHYIKIIDVADLIANVNNATELYIKLFSDIDNKIFNYREEFNKEKFLSRLNTGNLRIICIDSLDRLPLDKDQIIRDFFRQSQHILTSMKKNTLLIISCADRWKQFLNSTDLSYLGSKNQWTLERFQTDEIKEMLDKRLISAGSSFCDIFNDDCVVPLQTMSAGNPRQILINAENACRLAHEENEEKIDATFLAKKYKSFFEQAYTELFEEQSHRVPDFKNGLVSLYCYYCEMERRNLDINLGFDIITQLTSTDIKQNTIKIQYHGPIRYIAKIVSKKENDIYYNYYSLHNQFKVLFEILKKNGFTAKGFLSFFSVSPEKFIPSADKDDIINTFKEYLISTDDIGYYEKAKLDYIDTTKNVNIAHMFIRKSWDIIEEMLVAILIKTRKITAQKYEAEKSKVYWHDDLGRQRFVRGYGEIMSMESKELIDLFLSIIKELNIFMTHYPSLQWIRIERNNIIKGKTQSYSKYGEKSLEICRNHLDLSFRELLEIYERIRLLDKYSIIDS